MKVRKFTLSLPNLKDVSSNFEKKRNGLEVLNICDHVCFYVKYPNLGFNYYVKNIVQ